MYIRSPLRKKFGNKSQKKISSACKYNIKFIKCNKWGPWGYHVYTFYICHVLIWIRFQINQPWYRPVHRTSIFVFWQEAWCGCSIDALCDSIKCISSWCKCQFSRRNAPQDQDSSKESSNSRTATSPCFMRFHYLCFFSACEHDFAWQFSTPFSISAPNSGKVLWKTQTRQPVAGPTWTVGWNRPSLQD